MKSSLLSLLFPLPSLAEQQVPEWFSKYLVLKPTYTNAPGSGYAETSFVNYLFLITCLLSFGGYMILSLVLLSLHHGWLILFPPFHGTYITEYLTTMASLNTCAVNFLIMPYYLVYWFIHTSAAQMNDSKTKMADKYSLIKLTMRIVFIISCGELSLSVAIGIVERFGLSRMWLGGLPTALGVIFVQAFMAIFIMMMFSLVIIIIKGKSNQ